MGMTVKRIIDGLYFTVGMMLFNPMTGEGKTPDQLNEDDRATYDACMGAINLLKAQEPVEPVRMNHTENKYRDHYRCPICKEDLSYGQNYCPDCGKAVKWE